MKVVDLFSGAGGWCATADVEIVGFSETDQTAAATFAANHPAAAPLGDAFGDLPDLRPDGIVASPPCQPYSIMAGEGITRADTTRRGRCLQRASLSAESVTPPE